MRILNNTTIAPVPSAEIHNQTFEREFTFNYVAVLLMDIKKFQVANILPAAMRNINQTIDEQSQKYYNYVYNTLYPDAVNQYKERQTNGYPFNLFGTSQTYTITYNQDCFLSTYRDEYFYTGGAHGTTTKYGTTFDLNTGKVLPLSHFFARGVDYKKIILEQVLNQAQQNMELDPGIYFEDYAELIVENFNVNNYYLSNDGIVVYFGQYEIAPYATGIVEFTIPYSLVTYPPKCK